MQLRALVRRAFPYLVIAVAGFAVAYVIVFVFVLPSRIVPRRAPSVPELDKGGHTAGNNAPGDSLVAPPPETTLSSPVPFSPPMSTAPLPGALPAMSPDAVQVPDLAQMALSDALAVLHDLRLTARVRRDTNSSQPENTVLRQSPPAGTTLAPGGSVVLTVSLFPPLRGTSPNDSPAHDSVRPSDAVRHDSVSHGHVAPAPLPPPPDTMSSQRDTTPDTTSH